MKQKMQNNKIFYSWQSDLPNATNRNFIEKSLEKVVKSIRDDNSIQVEPVIDRDTIGVPGAPDISSTILAKIDQSIVFVCDVSIINDTSEKRLTPNPNILIELGYAVKTLGTERIVMVMNTAFGNPEQLPFDLRMKRVITYNMPASCKERATERKNLEAYLKNSLFTILEKIEKEPYKEIDQKPSISKKTIEAVGNSSNDQVLLIREFMQWFIEELEKLNPDFSGKGEEEWENLTGLRPGL